MWGTSNEKNKKEVSLPIDVAHCIEEYIGAFLRVDKNTIHQNMPTIFIVVVVIDVPPPCDEAVIVLPDKEHFSGEIGKVRIIHKFHIEFGTGLLPKRAPWSHNLRRIREVHGNVVECRHIKSPITLSVSHNKFAFQPCTSTSLMGHTRKRALKRHKWMDKRDLLVGLRWRRWITPLESSFCDFRSSNSHTTRSVSATG